MPATRFAARILPLLPGTALSIAVTLAAVGLEAVEVRLFGRAWLESLVLAILIGTAVRSLLRPGRPLQPRHPLSAPRRCSRSPWSCSAPRSAPGR